MTLKHRLGLALSFGPMLSSVPAFAQQVEVSGEARRHLEAGVHFMDSAWSIEPRVGLDSALLSLSGSF